MPMIRVISIIAAMLACAACQSTPGPQVARLPEATQPVCHDFSTRVKAGGRPEQASGQACEQPDGSWQVAQNTPGLPTQTYVLPPAGQSTAATPSPAAQQPPAQPLSNQPPGSPYPASVIVGGQPRQAVIE